MPSSVIAPADTNESELKSHPLLKNTDSQIVDIIESEVGALVNGQVGCETWTILDNLVH